MLTLFLERKTDFFKKKYRVLHISPEYSTQWLFKKQHGEEYLSADLHSPIAMTHFDIQNIPFQDNHFSVIICGHVLAFVDNDEKALSELQRVLRPDGYLILQTDLHQHPDTVLHSDMEVSAMRTYSQWERLRSYGLDFFNKIESAGLSYQNISFGRSLTAREIEYFGINPEEIIIFCTKPS